MLRKMRSNAYWTESGRVADSPTVLITVYREHGRCAFLVKRISCGTTSNEDRCRSIFATVVDGFMNKADEGTRLRGEAL